MADNAQHYTFRARMSQLFNNFFMRQPQEQQRVQKSDRQVADGFTRGNDDPDRRSQPAQQSRTEQQLSAQDRNLIRDMYAEHQRTEQARMLQELAINRQQQQRGHGRGRGY